LEEVYKALANAMVCCPGCSKTARGLLVRWLVTETRESLGDRQLFVNGWLCVSQERACILRGHPHSEEVETKMLQKLQSQWFLAVGTFKYQNRTSIVEDTIADALASKLFTHSPNKILGYH
jgi:hypothetical protein